MVYKDERLQQLDSIPQFQSHSSVLTKMYLNRIVQKQELEQFESSLADHQKAIMADGLTIVERGVLEHNMVAVSHLYKSIYFSQLAELLGVVDCEKAEKVAAKMITDGLLSGSIDEMEGVLYFHPPAKDESSLLRWDETITSFCVQLNKVTDAVRASWETLDYCHPGLLSSMEPTFFHIMFSIYLSKVMEFMRKKAN